MPPRYSTPPTPPPLTEKLLIAAGGWEVIRHARGIREAGRVMGAQWSPPLLQGTVLGEGREFRAGLRILSPTNIENLCTCRPSREYGTICAHSVAVGLAVVAGMEPVPAPSKPAAGPARPAAPGPPVILPTRPDPAATARLHVVLAPDLGAAWDKGSIVVVMEIESKGRRTMLGAPNGFPGATPLLPDDHKVVAGLAAIIKTSPGGMAILKRSELLELLETTKGFSRLSLGKSTLLRVDPTPLLPPLQAKMAADGALELAVAWPAASRPLAANGRAWLLRAAANAPSIQPVSPGLPAVYAPLFEPKPLRLPAGQAAAFLSVEWAKLAPFFELRTEVAGMAPLAGAGATTGTPDPGVEPGQPKFALSIEGSLNQLGARLQATYPNKRIITVGVTPEREAFTYPPPEGTKARLHTRNVPAERKALDRLVDFDFSGPDTTGHYFLRGEGPILRFFALGLPALQKEPGWEVSIGARFQNVSRNIEIITPEVAVRGSGEDWFEMELSMTGSSGERFPASEIQRLLQMGQGHTRLRNGKLAILPAEALNDLQEVLRDCDPSQPSPGVYRLARSQGAYVDATLEKWGVGTGPSWEQWRERGGGFRRGADVPLPSGLGEALRPYQHDGVRWLHLLSGNGLGGILADEMGLGKTLQALAFLASMRHADAGDRQPSLVVCPTSLVDNWQREAARFTPGLKTLPIDGPDRAPLFAKIDGADLVVTSYALLRRDLDRYRARTFDAVILDEAHHIKNPDSQVAQAACALRSRHRFVLTGTPMENSVRDLWSIMRFALPGYLGSRQDFRERYEQPLARPGDPAAGNVRERLSRRLRPVLLRRRKKDVATELPDRIEQTAFCDLTAAQAQVYAQLLEQSRLKLDTARRDKNQGAGRMLVLTALLRLRQACCDLRLLGLPEDGTAPNVDPEVVPASSAKLALLDELLEEIREGGHRVLIFSQFVSMLKILSGHLEKSRTPFCYLDGSTKPKDRTVQVDRFQADESMTAFLISVKAGGVGLNLTGADTVIHFDPWWNPAVEAQATDRAHRIGQTRVVTAYRLIARGTVEEKIFALQNRKRELTASLVEREKDEPLLETLSFEEIESLLE